MTFLITAQDKKTLLEQSGQLSELVFSQEQIGTAFYKVLVNYIQKTAPIGKLQGIESWSQVQTPETMKKSLSELLQSIVEIASATTQISVKVYTTGELSRIFGVSITTINKWIQSGRLIGIHKEGEQKQARIPESAVWINTSGEQFTIREVIERFPNKALQSRKSMPHDELKAIVDDVVFFEGKYGGEFKNSRIAIKITNCEELTAEEQRDVDEWKYLLSRLEGKL